MQTNTVPLWRLRALTFLFAAAAAASVGYWGLKLGSARSVATLVPSADRTPTVDAQAVVRALGGGAVGKSAAASAPSRSPFVLVGVLADRKQAGVALIAVDGKAAKPFAVGAQVDADWTLLAVEGRKATLAGPGDVRAELELPPLIRP